MTRRSNWAAPLERRCPEGAAAGRARTVLKLSGSEAAAEKRHRDDVRAKMAAALARPDVRAKMAAAVKHMWAEFRAFRAKGSAA